MNKKLCNYVYQLINTVSYLLNSIKLKIALCFNKTQITKMKNIGFKLKNIIYFYAYKLHFNLLLKFSFNIIFYFLFQLFFNFSTFHEVFASETVHNAIDPDDDHKWTPLLLFVGFSIILFIGAAYHEEILSTLFTSPEPFTGFPFEVDLFAANEQAMRATIHHVPDYIINTNLHDAAPPFAEITSFFTELLSDENETPHEILHSECYKWVQQHIPPNMWATTSEQIADNNHPINQFLQIYADSLPPVLDQTQSMAHAAFRSSIAGYNAANVLHCLDNEEIMKQVFWTSFRKLTTNPPSL